MKSAWDKIFQSDAPLTDAEREQALTELVQAVATVDQIRATPEHERIRKQIEEKLACSTSAESNF